MDPPKPLYRVRVSSSGLIYAVIVGAWAAYLVPMWLRRQDELNEARPTERFSTAIRLLSGKAAMERRYAKEAERRQEAVLPAAPAAVGDPAGLADPGGGQPSDSGDAYESAPDAAREAVDVRAFADPKTMVGPPQSAHPTEILRPAATGHGPRAEPAVYGAEYEDDDVYAESVRHRTAHPHQPADPKAARTRQNTKRAKVLARRRRTTMVLFLAFTLGAIVAAVGGLTFLWVPVLPGSLLSAYIVHLRVQERRRFVVTMDRRRAEAAAQRLRERRPRPRRGHTTAPAPEGDAGAEPADDVKEVEEEPGAADRRALVEETDHAEWVDQQRGDRENSEGEGWDPVPVPLPTYVSAPVAPRNPRAVDLGAPDTWSSARSTTAEDQQHPLPDGPADGTGTSTGSRRGRTPLFDQYENEDRPRAANE
jgi:hypothetical protein